MLSAVQTSTGLRPRFEGMLLARQEVLTPNLDLSEGAQPSSRKGQQAGHLVKHIAALD